MKKPDRKLLLAVTVLLAAASFALSKPAVGTTDRNMGGATAVLVAKLFGRS
jgi:hypothetical protein